VSQRRTSWTTVQGFKWRWKQQHSRARDWADRAVDDPPAGGWRVGWRWCDFGADVLAAAIDAASLSGDSRPRLLMSPRGTPLTSRGCASSLPAGALIVCGRFEGVDERVIAGRELEEVSVGDYVLSGGEIAAMVLLDACVRLLPASWGPRNPAPRKVLRPACSSIRTLPARGLGGAKHSRGAPVGHHGRIVDWRNAEAERLTRQRRPDLWADYRTGGTPAKDQA
jgi:tRNA (guanine37-N1)-methyltransferase